MTGQKVETRKQTNGYIVNVSWQYGEPTPAFARLMALLLQAREEQTETKNGEKDAKEQHFPGGGGEV